MVKRLRTGRAVYSVSAVARMIGVPVATVRTWEDRYGLVIPDRSAGGHGLYRRDQVEQLKFVRACMADGATAADAHRLLAERDEGGPPVAARADAPARLVILLADCDPYAAQVSGAFPEDRGFEVEVALSQEKARESFSQKAPPLAVVELLISGGAGLDLRRFFKEHGDVLVVAVSVLESRDLALEAGADAFLLKPLESLQLVSSVRDLLGSSAFLGPVATAGP
jgi:DNA-binding transcriptional MerR regulator